MVDEIPKIPNTGYISQSTVTALVGGIIGSAAAIAGLLALLRCLCLRRAASVGCNPQTQYEQLYDVHTNACAASARVSNVFFECER